MDKTAIKNFAVWARRKLIENITYKAGLIGITEDGIAEKLPQSTSDLYFFDIGTKNYAEVKGNAINQREQLIKEIRRKEADLGNYKEAFENIVEEVAYTWFNRLIAIRFMEVNDYLPSGVRVLSSLQNGKDEPDIVTAPFDADIEYTAKEKEAIINLKTENKLDELFRMLFVKQCNELYNILPNLFEQTDDYTEMLLTLSFTDKDGVVYHLTHDISEENFDIEKEGQVEIIGWMFQYYNFDVKTRIDALVKKNEKVTKTTLPAKTQLFTPDWIVRYLVENTLINLCDFSDDNRTTYNNLKFYINSQECCENNKNKYDIDKITFIDPCMGSGHILVYAFELYMKLYLNSGYSPREAATLILENNIFGIELDKRAYQLAYFALMMKARQYDSRFFKRNIKLNLAYIKNSVRLNEQELALLEEDEKRIAINLIEEFSFIEDIGSLIQPKITLDEIEKLCDYINNKIALSDTNLIDYATLRSLENKLGPVIEEAKILVSNYNICVTNPPYLGNKPMNAIMSSYLSDYYKDSKMDLFSSFIERCILFSKDKVALVTPESWMFLSVFENLRNEIIKTINIESLLQLGTNAFEVGFGTCAFVLCKKSDINIKGKFIDLKDADFDTIETINQDLYACYERNNEFFLKLPNSVIAYWCPQDIAKLYLTYPIIEENYELNCGIKTGRKEEFMRRWYEVSMQKTCIDDPTLEDIHNGKYKWFKYNKGGGYKKWYGNMLYVVDLENDAINIKNNVPASTYRLRNPNNYFKNGIMWPLTGGDKFSCRYLDNDVLIDVASNAIYLENNDDTLALMGYMNTHLYNRILNMINPTVSFPINTIANSTCLVVKDSKINILVEENIEIERNNWNEDELSWNFKKNPLISGERSIEIAITNYINIIRDRCNKVSENESYINEFYNDYYNVKEDNSIQPAQDSKEENEIHSIVISFISYAVGCMVGRYSLDVEGLAYAGGEWDTSKYTSFIPDGDNCIPITDEAYFKDDIVARFEEFVRVVYGEDSLEDNLKFIADALKTKGLTSRECIRNYFLKDFIKDHYKKYQKCPIYWVFDSGKHNGFKALVYMHRWNADTVGNVRVEYLHKMQRVYDNELIRMNEIIDNSSDSKEVTKATKRKEKLQKQIKETEEFDAMIGHLPRTDIDLDDGVKVNYEKVQTAADGKKMQILTKI